MIPEDLPWAKDITDPQVGQAIALAAQAIFDDPDLWVSFTDRRQDLRGPREARWLAARVAVEAGLAAYIHSRDNCPRCDAHRYLEHPRGLLTLSEVRAAEGHYRLAGEDA